MADSGKFLSRLEAAGRRPVTEQGRSGGRAGSNQLLDEAVEPGLGFNPLPWARHVPNIAVAQVEEVPGGGSGTGGLVDKKLAGIF
jgi:hypothetical protein